MPLLIHQALASLMMHFPLLRTWISGKPSLLIRQGEVQADATKEIKRLGVAARTGQAGEAAVAVSDLRLIMQQILGRNTLSWEHIF